MTAPRTHYADRQDGPLVVALCGQMPTPQFATRDREAVTCRSCLRKLSVVPFAPSELTEAEPWKPPPPKLMVDKPRWLDLPAHTRQLALRRDPAERRRRWRSPEDAARFVAGVRADGYSAQSASGAVERIGRAGTRVQTSGRSSNRSTRTAEDVADIARAFTVARGRITLPQGVAVDVAMRVWRDVRVGRPLTAREWAGRQREERTHFVVDDAATVGARYGLDAGLVTAVALEVHRALYAEMRDRGLCPGGRAKL